MKREDVISRLYEDTESSQAAGGIYDNHIQPLIGGAKLFSMSKEEIKADLQNTMTEKRVSVDVASHHGDTALGAFAFDGNLAGVQAALELNANVNKKNEMLETPLMLAAKMGHPDVMRTLIAAGATVDENKSHYFMNVRDCAVKSNNPEAVQLIDAALSAKAQSSTAPSIKATKLLLKP